MDYKEKYEMALETLQEILDSGSDSIKMSRLKLRLQSVFPELKKSKDEKIRKVLIDFFSISAKRGDQTFGVDDEDILAWLKKLGEQQPLYIRFGEIPDNEKSKIYRGEEEIGEEDGVSVYPAFEVNGDIVLGLTLPITRTTLYTQQHLLEYENRPCYLVKGDYVGKDADGQPLICNAQIIKKIDNYRIKEEKADKIEPKFHPNDWVVCEDDRSVHQIEKCVENVSNHKYGYDLTEGGYISSDDANKWHLWNFENDAKNGDVLIDSDDNPFIYNGHFTSRAVCGYCGITLNTFVSGDHIIWNRINKEVKPATREQRNLLFQKIEEDGYEWDAENKKLNNKK